MSRKRSLHLVGSFFFFNEILEFSLWRAQGSVQCSLSSLLNLHIQDTRTFGAHYAPYPKQNYDQPRYETSIYNKVYERKKQMHFKIS
jgi:hypothetical protein